MVLYLENQSHIGLAALFVVPHSIAFIINPLCLVWRERNIPSPVTPNMVWVSFDSVLSQKWGYSGGWSRAIRASYRG